MTTDTAPNPAPLRSESTGTYVLKLLSGVAAFAIVMLAPIALPYEGRIALATFVCAIVWWTTQPIPWALAAMLPLFVFPAAGVMDIATTLRLYGQPIFFWTMGAVLVGYAIEKHGLARRVALAFLALPGVGGRTRRLTFAYLLVVGIVSMFVSDASTVAMMMPIGMSLGRHVGTMSGTPAGGKTNFGVFLTLGTLYAAVAGGTATMMGVPHNAIVVSLLARLAGRSLGFFEWMTVGLPVFLSLLAAAYVLLWVLVPPEILDLPGGEAFLREEQARIGPMRPNERRVLWIFVTMVLLFTLPTLAGLALGERHAVAAWITRALPFWIVPPAAMFLLFAIRSTDGGVGLLSWKDAQQHAPWNVMFLLAGAVGMTEALTQFGFVELMGGLVRQMGIGATSLPYFVAAIMSVSTNFISGTAAAALYGNIFIPAAVQVGYNPASIAILIANLGVGMVFPWAGATSATAFAGGDVSMTKMMRVGVVVTVVFTILIAVIHHVLAALV